MARVEPGAARSRQRFPSFEQFQLIGLLIGVAWIGPRTYAAFTSPSIGLIARCRAAQLQRDIEAKLADAEVMVIPRASARYVPFRDETVRMT